MASGNLRLSPQVAVRGAVVAFEELFVEEDGSATSPLDPTAYPSVAIYSPTEEMLQSGVGSAVSGSEGRWRFTWFVPLDADLSGPDAPWRIEWVMVTPGGRQVERHANFFVVDNVEASSEERAYTSMVYAGQSERVFAKFRNRQERIQVNLVDQGEDYVDLTPGVVEVQQDGFYTYYVDTPELTTTGCYLAVWNSRQTAISQSVTSVQQIRVPESKFWWLQPSIRMLLDKAQKKIGHVQSYSDSDLYEYMMRGADYINATNPITGWTLTNWPGAFGMTNFLLMASAWYGLQAQYLGEAETAFNFSGQTVTLDIDRTSYYADAMSRFKDYLDNDLQKTKRNMLRRVSVGALASRPLSFGLESLVARVQTTNGGKNQALPIFSRLGLL